MYALCQFMKNGNVFPVCINIQTKGEGSRALHWQKIGQGQFDDWRIITMTELRQLLLADKVDLHIFTDTAQTEMRETIMGEGRK